MIVTFVCTRLRMDLKYFSAISNIVLRILLECTHIYQHDKEDDSITENIDVGYLRHGFEFFLNGFAYTCVPTLVSLVPSRTRWALSIPKKNFEKYPPLPFKNQKKLQKNKEKTWKLLKNPNGFASLASLTIPRLIPDWARRALSIPIKKISLSPHLYP
jgi:hypothetical protein